MFKNIYFRLAIISTVSTAAFLIALPRIPITVNKPWLKVDTIIGGYSFSLFNGRYHFDFSRIKEGLDLAGGIKVVLGADMTNIPESEKDNAIESAKTVIERRVNLLGVTEPTVATLKVGDEYRIVVEIPGLDNVAQAVSLIGQTAQLRFKELKPDVEWSQEKFADYQFNPEIWQDTEVSGADLKGADVITTSQGDLQGAGQPQIQLRFTNAGRNKFSEVAKRNVSRPIGIFLDEGEMPLSMPVVSPDLAEGITDDPVISGSFTFEMAKQLGIQLRAGALPVPVKVLEQETVGATLGKESVAKSLYAGVVGLLLVFTFMVFKYGRLGLLAGLSLLIYSVIVLTVFKMLGVVLTLPGIAGFVLSIGMATDANILVFERIKEEILWGKPPTLATKLGFERAWNSIRDSNVSSLITSFILFRSGDGPVRGFALTLAIGILVSLFTSILVVKTFIEVFEVGKEKVKA